VSFPAGNGQDVRDEEQDVPPGKGELLPYPMVPGPDLFTAGMEDLR
jgi:hypothetical protein